MSSASQSVVRRPTPQVAMAMSPLLLAVVLVSTMGLGSMMATAAPPSADHFLGVNYGTLGDNLPPPQRGMELARSAGAAAVRFYDANATLLAAAAAVSGLVFVPSVPNELIPSLAASQRAADAWVAATLLPYRRSPGLRYLFVGNEVLSDPTTKSRWPLLVPAMANVERALRRHGLGRVKVSTTFSMHELAHQNVFPPSAGVFRPDIADAVMRPLLAFLDRTESYLFFDAYTYFTWSANHSVVPLPYALLEPASSPGRGFVYHDAGTGLSYGNLLDQMLDAVVAAACRVGHCGVRLGLAETGWPTAGDLDQFGANVRNAATYNRNLARHLASGAGTPRRPGMRMPAMVFALFNEDLKWGPTTERHWGLFYPNGTKVYEVDLTGRRTSYPAALPPATNDRPYPGPLRCVVKAAANETAVREQAAAACADKAGLCDAVRPGGACYVPNTVAAHASYVFSAHWNSFSEDYGGCYFAGLAVETTVDPSHGSCRFPSILLK